MHKSALLGLALASSVLVGCASKTTAPEQYSGFLADYSQLKPFEAPSGEPLLRWETEGFDVNRYASIMIEPVCFHPKPVPSEQVSAQVIDDICRYSQQQLTRELAKVRPIVKQASGDTLVVRAALTAVSTANEEWQPYEVLPVTIVVAGAMMAAGKRDQQVALFFEAEALDGGTSKAMVRSVRKVFGENLSNKDAQLTVKDVQPVIDRITQDARLLLQ